MYDKLLKGDAFVNPKVGFAGSSMISQTLSLHSEAGHLPLAEKIGSDELIGSVWLSG